MPAHIKASVLGPSLSLPIADGRLALGTWQGIYLCEHRDRPSGRRAARDGLGRGPSGPSRPGRASRRRRSRPRGRPRSRTTGPAISPWRCHASSSLQSGASTRIALGGLERERAVGGDRGGELAAPRDRLARLGQAVDEADLGAALGADRVAGQGHLHRQVVRHPLRQAQQRAAGRDQRALGLRDAELAPRARRRSGRRRARSRSRRRPRSPRSRRSSACAAGPGRCPRSRGPRRAGSRPRRTPSGPCRRRSPCRRR